MSNPTLVNNMEKTSEEYFSFEAILGDLVKWRIAGKDVGGTLPPRKMWSRAGVKERKGVDPAVVRKQAIFRTVRRAMGGHAGRVTLPCGALGERALPGGGRGATALAKRRYKGHPFSYSGFLEKAVRPTNMDRRRPVVVLPYSEL